MDATLKVAVAAALLIGCSGVAAPQSSAQDEADVGLTIGEYCSVDIRDPTIVMTTVTGAWIGTNQKTVGSSIVDVKTNFNATLSTPDQITLSDGASYTVDVDVCLTGTNLAYYSTEGGVTYVNLDFGPGDHSGQTTLGVSLKKLWSYSDAADTYTGTVILQLMGTP